MEYSYISVKGESVPLIFKKQNEAILEIKPNGEIYVKGKLSNNDKEIVDTLREWVEKFNNK